jgi:hypothetical protein
MQKRALEYIASIWVMKLVERVMLHGTRVLRVQRQPLQVSGVDDGRAAAVSVSRCAWADSTSSPRQDTTRHDEPRLDDTHNPGPLNEQPPSHGQSWKDHGLWKGHLVRAHVTGYGGLKKQQAALTGADAGIQCLVHPMGS